MAKSPAHRFGQILGDVLEQAVEPIVKQQAEKHGLYLDRKGKRKCRKGIKLSWIDKYKNSYDLDFVLERHGSNDKQGAPAAFIEVAWRRYTKHSKAKAQEMQGALLPLLEEHVYSAPFIGIVLAGEWTAPARNQLESVGFTLLSIPTNAIVEAFKKFGIDADTDEDTSDDHFQAQVEKYENLTQSERNKLIEILFHKNKVELDKFSESLDKVLSRQITRIIVLPLYGTALEFTNILEVLTSLKVFPTMSAGDSFVRFEIEIRYDSGNTIKGSFIDSESARAFLHLYQDAYLPSKKTA